MKIAVVTGASSGMGREFVCALDRQTAFDEIWVIARRRDRLEALQGAVHAKVRPLAWDLTKEESFDAYRSLLAEERPEVSVLVNAGGFGVFGAFASLSESEQLSMIDLNVKALMRMTHLTLPYMKAGSHILNTSSIASFCANAKLNTYSATKAYVSSFTRGLSYELRNRGVSATAVCPGPMATEFVTVGGITGNSPEFERLPYCDSQQVALSAMTAAKHGHVFYTPTAFYKFYRVAAKLLPHALVVRWAKCGD